MAPSLDKRDADRDAAQIPQFYAGREVFITGATGFIGKMLTERLLATCPDIGRVHLLMRMRDQDSPMTALCRYKETPVFEVIREKCPKQLDKLNLIPGDIKRTDLGLTDDSLAELQNVSVVFHLAASVKMDEPLEVAVKMNALAPMVLLDVCDRLPKMAAFIHVSTGYCYTERLFVEETVYPLPRPLDAMVEDSLHAGQMAPDEFMRFISPKANSYAFTKTMAETVMKQHGNRGYPIAIFRPTIVTSALRSPFPGWVAGVRGPAGAALAATRGVMRVMVCAPRARADFLPVDIAADTLVALAWETAVDNLPEVRVYNCSTGDNPTTFGEMYQGLMNEIRENPSSATLWYPSSVLVANPYLLNIAEFFMEIVPMYIVDFIMKIFCDNDKRIDLKAVSQRLVSFRKVLHTFTTREYWFATDNVRRLRARLAPRDAALYNTDPASIRWDEYYKDFAKGVRLHLIKDKESGSPAARKRFKRLQYIHAALTVCLVLALAWVARGALLLGAGWLAGRLPAALGRVATDLVLYLETF